MVALWVLLQPEKRLNLDGNRKKKINICIFSDNYLTNLNKFIPGIKELDYFIIIINYYYFLSIIDKFLAVFKKQSTKEKK